MQNVTIAKFEVNVAALDEVLRGLLGADFIGLSSGPSGVTLHLADRVSQADIDAATALVNSHDALLLTNEQQAAIDRDDRIETLEAALTVDETKDPDALTTSQMALLMWMRMQKLGML